ncbi:MAG TPA: hypothetical protein VK136_08760 [Bacillota bacterium]|nr:hypothetical protein [Bacillota bacterium]
MSIGLVIFLVVLFIVALGLTLYAFKQEEKKMKQYEEQGVTSADELRRSHEYESRSLKSNVLLLILIYVIAIILAVVLFVWYVS